MGEQLDGLIDLQRYYIQLRAQIDERDAELKEQRKRCTEVEGQLAEQMAAIGQPHTMIDGHRLTVRTTPRISKRSNVTAEQLIGVIKNTDFAWMVKPGVHAQTLQATMKEVLEEQGKLPDELEPLLRRWDQTTVAVTKG